MFVQNVTNSYLDEEEWIELLQKYVVDVPYWVRVLFVVSMLCIFVLGIIGNLVTCVVIYSDKTMHTATNYYLFDLAVSDLLVSMGIILEINEHLENYQKLFLYKWDLACKMHFLMVVALWNNGILIMTALAIERYIAILRPLLLNSRPVWRRVMKIIMLVWTMAILETLPEVWTLKLITTPSFSACIIVPTEFSRWLNGIIGLITFIIPLMIMIFVYTTIALKVNITAKTNPRDKVFNHRDNRSKVNKLIVALTLSFVCCWLPFFSLRILIFAIDVRYFQWYLKNWHMLVMLCSFNGWFSIVLNPMLFSLMSTKFRKALKTLWDTKIMKRPIKRTMRPGTSIVQ